MIRKTCENGFDDIIDQDALKEPKNRIKDAKKDLGKIRQRLEGIVFEGGKALYELSGGDNTLGNVGKRIEPCFSRGDDDYISNVIKGIRLHDHVLTKMTPSYAYPQIFLFTDTADSERHFLTGPAKTMRHLFE